MKKGLKIFLSIIIFIAVFLLIINIIPPKKVIKDNPFVTDGLPMLCAHRGGSISNPENTLKAYKNSVKDYQVEILETDLWLTLDNQLVLNHDESINRTSDVEVLTNSTEPYLISDHTLEELRQFNFGYNFKIDNQYPYRDLVTADDENRAEIIKENDLSIVTLDELLSCFYDNYKDMLFIVEIKDGGERGYTSAQIIDDLLTQKYPDYKNRIVIGTFHDEIEQNLKEEHPSLLRGASPSAVVKFVVTQLLKVNIFENQNIACLQLPLSQYGINLTWNTYIKRAHRKNIAVQYWTVNDEDEMRMLIKKGCDAIMTDDPELLRKVLNEFKK